RCADVAPLAEAGAHVQDAARTRLRPELLFLDAGCRLNAGHAAEAAKEFGELLADFPDAARARDAADYRFRPLDGPRAGAASLPPAYEASLRDFVARHGTDPSAGEARYLLGELSRAQGNCPQAEAAYAQVTAGPFVPRARLGALECDVGGLVKSGPSAS